MDVKDHFVHRIVLTDSSLFKNKKDFLKWKPEKLKDNEFLIDLFARRKNYNCFDLVGYQSAVTDLTNSIETEKVDIDEKKENLIPNFTDATTKNGNPKESVLPRRSFHVSKVDAKRIINFLEKFIGKNEGFKVSVWEWMCMQNPTKSFDSLPAFPGQRYPGLGIAKKIIPRFFEAAEKKKRDAVMVVPDHLHHALLYGKHGYCRAVYHDLKPILLEHGVAMISWCLNFGYIIDKKTNTSLLWKPQEQ
ncbi:hypothetical protein HDU92_009013, partial [Lobulomyces angularis]